MVVRSPIVIKGTTVDGTGDPLLTKDATTSELGTVASLGSGFVSSTLASGNIIVGNGSNVATSVAMSGDGTISNAGVFAISTGVIVNADINASAAIDYSKLNLVGGIVNADINASAAIAYSKLNLVGSILNADINASAAIARTKIASGTAYRILANNASGVLSENASITASRAVASDSNGQLVASATTATQLGYLSTTTSDVQAQMDSKIASRQTNAIVQNPTVTEDGYAITWDNTAGEYTLTDPVTQGIPVGGSTRQFLGKNSGTNYDASWLTLQLSDVTDVTASASDVNLLAGQVTSGLTSAHLSYVIGATSNLQAQINNKLSSTLAQNAIFVGNASNVASSVAAGSEGQVLTITSGVPTWQTVVGTGTVTSINVSGGTTGLSFTGGPITTTGTITASGTLAVANGGTGSTVGAWLLSGTSAISGNATVSGAFDVRFSTTSVTFDDDVLRINNPVNTFYYQFVAGAISANRVISLPVAPGDRTMMVVSSGTNTNRIPFGTSVEGVYNNTSAFIYNDSTSVFGTPLAVVGSTTLTAGSVLADFQSTTLGVLMPRVTNIASVATPVNGMIAYDAATNKFNFRENGAWINLSSGGGWPLTGTAALTGNVTITGAGTYDVSIGTVPSPLNSLNIYADNGIILQTTLSGIGIAAIALAGGPASAGYELADADNNSIVDLFYFSLSTNTTPTNNSGLRIPFAMNNDNSTFKDDAGITYRWTDATDTAEYSDLTFQTYVNGAVTNERALKQARVTISGGATLRAIGTSPVTLIAAPGTNKFINIVSIITSYNYATAVYNFGANGIFRFNGAGSVGWLYDSSNLNAAGDLNMIVNVATNSSTNGGGISAPTNTAFQLGTVGGVDATTGDGDLDIVVYYTIEDTNA